MFTVHFMHKLYTVLDVSWESYYIHKVVSPPPTPFILFMRFSGIKWYFYLIHVIYLATKSYTEYIAFF